MGNFVCVFGTRYEPSVPSRLAQYVWQKYLVSAAEMLSAYLIVLTLMHPIKSYVG